MKLEDTIHFRLFTMSDSRYSEAVNSKRFIIECKGDKTKPIPLCISLADFRTADLVYKELFLIRNYAVQERSTPRALYNLLFSGYNPYNFLIEVKMKDITYYSAPGVLFNVDKQPLFYFAYTLDVLGHKLPKLYLTPRLLADSGRPGKPMEKFFMSTVVPYLVDSTVLTGYAYEGKVEIEIDNEVDNTFFIPGSELVSSVPIDQINSKLNNILADNADSIASFVDNYINVR